jgi:AAA ATPase domain
MDRSLNPYAPGAGMRPPELVGRDEAIEDIDVALARVAKGRSARHTILTGLRGVGKTVLLDHLHRLARTAGHAAVKIEAPENSNLVAQLIPELRRTLLELDRKGAAVRTVRRGFAALRNFAAAFKISVAGIDVEVTPDDRGLADSGDLGLDLKDLLCAVADAAADRSIALAIFIDEIQYLSSHDLGAFLAALHQVGQDAKPVLLVGAGLPQVAGLMGEAKSYSERLVRFVTIGKLDREAAYQALSGPADAEDVRWEQDALDRVYEITKGYPYFVQEWGSQTWDIAARTPIGLGDVERATPIAIEELDRSFFRVRLDRLSPLERRYLGAMAEEADGEQIASSAVAARLGKTVGAAAPARDSLIKKGMIYAVQHGEVGFTVPLFAEFMRRTVPTPLE